jgi:hypothetical protein
MEGGASIEIEIEKSALVFYGKVKRCSLVTIAETMDSDSLKKLKKILDTNEKMFLLAYKNILKAEIEVIKNYKGTIEKSMVEIFTIRQSSACGYPFKENKLYVVYASQRSHFYSIVHIQDNYRRENAFFTNVQTRTTREVFEELLLLEDTLTTQKTFKQTLFEFFTNFKKNF